MPQAPTPTAAPPPPAAAAASAATAPTRAACHTPESPAPRWRQQTCAPTAGARRRQRPPAAAPAPAAAPSRSRRRSARRTEALLLWLSAARQERSQPLLPCTLDVSTSLRPALPPSGQPQSAAISCCVIRSRPASSCHSLTCPPSTVLLCCLLLRRCNCRRLTLLLAHPKTHQAPTGGHANACLTLPRNSLVASTRLHLPDSILHRSCPSPPSAPAGLTQFLRSAAASCKRGSQTGSPEACRAATIPAPRIACSGECCYLTGASVQRGGRLGERQSMQAELWVE